MKYQVQENCLTVFLPHELDHHNAEEIRKESDHLIERNHIRYVIFDFAETNFMDSSGIGVIMGRYKRIYMLGGEVCAVHANERMKKILTMSGVTKIMQIYEEEKQMENTNEMQLIFDSRSSNESFARVTVAAFMTSLNPTVEEVSDVKTAVSEAVTNAIIHGYESEVHNIYIRCRTEGKTLYLEIEDEGKGIEDVKQAMEPLFTTKPELERSGMGFSFMEAFMDKLEVESVPGKGTTVKMEKTIGKGRRLWTTQSL